MLGDEGEIEIIRSDSDETEAQVLADMVRTWIDVDEIEPAEIAILVSKQQNLYCSKLCAALQAAGVPFREEDGAQDLAAEPIAKLIVDFLLVASGSREHAPYKRLLELVIGVKSCPSKSTAKEGAPLPLGSANCPGERRPTSAKIIGHAVKLSRIPANLSLGHVPSPAHGTP